MHTFKRLAVFCGSHRGLKKEYFDAAQDLALTLSTANIGLVYGGARVGLMGQLADAMLHYDKEVIGVLPKFLMDVEIAHEGLTELHVVETMHERKSLIAKLSDGFILLPGGIGSVEEFFEMATWNKLGVITKPCGILNIKNYFDPLLTFLDHMVNENFLKPVYRNMIIVEDTPEKLLRAFENYELPPMFKLVHEEIK